MLEGVMTDSLHVVISNGHTFGISNARQGVVVQVPFVVALSPNRYLNKTVILSVYGANS